VRGNPVYTSMLSKHALSNSEGGVCVELTAARRRDRDVATLPKSCSFLAFALCSIPDLLTLIFHTLWPRALTIRSFISHD